jgi:cytochrome c-type biogenesis protein CcmH/NrfG
VEDKIFIRSIKKKSAMIFIAIAFATGFIIGAAVAILSRKNGFEKSMTIFFTKSHIAKEPISIELMEKIEDLKETVRQNPNHLSAWLKLGNIYFDHNRYREAIDAYSQYLAIKPEDPDVRTRMGTMLRGLGDFDGAIEEFRKVAQSDPKHGDSRFQMGVVFLQDKSDAKEAMEAWREFLQVEPKGHRADWVRAEMKKLEGMNP